MDTMNGAGFGSYSFSQRILNSEKNYKKMCFRRKPYPCSVCDKTFPTEIVLTEHKQTHKGGSFTCYRCGEVTLTLTKMVTHMRIHFIQGKKLALGEQTEAVDSFIEIPDESIEIEPLNVEDSSTKQMPKQDSIKLNNNDCSQENANNSTEDLKDQGRKETYESKDKNLTSVKNNSIGGVENGEKDNIPCKDSKYMKRDIGTKKRLSTINPTKANNKKKRNNLVENSNTCTDTLTEEKKCVNEDTSTISNTKNVLVNKSKDKTETMDNAVNENIFQESIIDSNEILDKELGNSQIEYANEASKSSQENQDLLIRKELSKITDQNGGKTKDPVFNFIANDKGKIKCDQCDYETKYKSNLNVHKKKHQPKELRKCQHCSFKSKFKGIMERHIKRHMDNEGKIKKGKNDANPGILITKKKKSGNEKISAKIKKGINIKENKDDSVNISLGYYKVTGEIKDSKNKKRKYIKKNKVLVKDKSANKITYKCKNCTYKCLTKFRMKVHEKTHSNENIFNCPHCEYSTKRKGTLKIHIRTHTGEKPYSCPKCDYRCTTSTALKKHVMIHTGEKPFKCSFCDYRCIQSNTMKGHIKTHSDEKLFKCHQCDYSCKLKNSFQLHLDTHKEIK